jgi:hypothetical protein
VNQTWTCQDVYVSQLVRSLQASLNNSTGIYPVSMWILWTVKPEWGMSDPHSEWKGFLNLPTGLYLQN